jgi:hypothetical protein
VVFAVFNVFGDRLLAVVDEEAFCLVCLAMQSLLRRVGQNTVTEGL